MHNGQIEPIFEASCEIICPIQMRLTESKHHHCVYGAIWELFCMQCKYSLNTCYHTYVICTCGDNYVEPFIDTV